MNSPTIRIVLADDHTMVRESMAAMLDGQHGLVVVGQASGGHEALTLCEELQPDVLLLDYQMPGMSGFGVIERLKAAASPTRVLVVSQFDSLQYATRSLEAGAKGFVVKTGSLEELVGAVHRVHEGGRVISRALEGQMAEHMGKPRRRTGLDALSPREFEMLGNLGDGLTVQEAAEAMHVGESTASTYKNRLMEKLDLHSTHEVIRFAIEHGVGRHGRLPPSEGHGPRDERGRHLPPGAGA